MSKFDLLQELKEPSVIWDQNPEDPSNPEILVPGWGRVTLKVLEKEVKARIADIAQKAAEAHSHMNWRNVSYLLSGKDATFALMKALVQAKKEIEGVKESDDLNEMYGEFGDFEIDGYKLHQYEEYEDDNIKIWHEVIDPSGKRDILDHTPYEWLSKEDFAHYVDYHKKHGRWPGRRPMRNGSANWDRDTLKQMNRRLGPHHADRLNRFFQEKK